MNRDLVGMFADGNLGDSAKISRIKNWHHPPGPVRDVELPAVTGHATSYGRVPAVDFNSFRLIRSRAKIVPRSTSSE